MVRQPPDSGQVNKKKPLRGLFFRELQDRVNLQNSAATRVPKLKGRCPKVLPKKRQEQKALAL
jgi:hypothetical protein